MIGIDDEEFIRGEVPMTKQEIRILTLVKARIDCDSIVVDVGAGTGSISIEAAKIATCGKIFAVERKAEAVELIRRNVEKFSVDNVEIICAEAPEGMDDLPKLDAAIIGGSGKNLRKILDVLGERLKLGGRVVINAITIQTTADALNYFRENHWSYDACQVQVNRLRRVGSYDMANALNPVYIISAEKIINSCDDWPKENV
ncbi:MAG: precorrin-6Y C5,15-methyltransferase (decarboxylating) subunit CbiT [Selenomonadaceae bacterium]|nr:precorrin-6Y C5,15-methyltransferase (decarboxylating) subunit CbiT [Selenomonadaceae bacterium]